MHMQKALLFCVVSGLLRLCETTPRTKYITVNSLFSKVKAVKVFIFFFAMSNMSIGWSSFTHCVNVLYATESNVAWLVRAGEDGLHKSRWCNCQKYAVNVQCLSSLFPTWRLKVGRGQLGILNLLLWIILINFCVSEKPKMRNLISGEYSTVVGYYYCRSPCKYCRRQFNQEALVSITIYYSLF